MKTSTEVKFKEKKRKMIDFRGDMGSEIFHWFSWNNDKDNRKKNCKQNKQKTMLP